MANSGYKRQSAAAYWRTVDRRGKDYSLFPEPVVECALHPDTEPDAIAAVQRADVAAAVVVRVAAGADPLDLASLSDAVTLHPWIVQRRLVELGYDPPPVPKPAPKNPSQNGRPLAVCGNFNLSRRKRLPGGT